MPSPSQRATVRDAMNRLQKIHQACTNQAAAADNSSAEKQSASFQDLARMIAENIQTTKDRIQQRNIMVQKSHALDHDVIVLSHSITKDIMLVEDKVTKLETMLAESDREYNKALSVAHKKYSKHKDPDDGTKLNGHDFVSSLPMQVRSKIEQLERTATERRNVCQSMRQCVIDLQELNSKRVNNEKKGKNTENMKSVDLLQNKRTQLKDLLLMKQSGADSAARGNAYKPAGNETASVSRLEEDSETKALMAEIKKNEAKMDASLDMLLQGVKRLGEHAKNIQRELGEQEVTIVEVSDKMEATDEKLNSLNGRLKKITKSYQPTNMILTVGVIIILLGLIGYLVQDLIVNRGV